MDVSWYKPKPLDIWALGVTLYAYLFEALPFVNSTEESKYKLDIEEKSITQ